MTRTQTAYCSACDRDVQILVTDEADHDAQANIPDAEVVCLEIGDRCTGSLCPVGAISHSAMLARRVKVGVKTVLQPLVKVDCQACGHVTDYFIIDREYATCGECGTTLEVRQIVPALGCDN
jgi:ribosomal protein S27E